MTRIRFGLRRMMLAGGIVALACGGIVWLTSAGCLMVQVQNFTGSPLFDVVLDDRGMTRSLGDIQDGITHEIGRFADGSTPVIVSYTDSRGKRVSHTATIGADLRRPIERNSDGGQANLVIGPSGITSRVDDWVSW